MSQPNHMSTENSGRTPAHTSPPVALNVAGSDSSGGAGIQADLKTMEACDVFATSAVTSIAAGNTCGVESTHPLPPAEIEAQIDAILDDFDIGAVKLGLLGTVEIIQTVMEYTDEFPNLVVDPVMITVAGDRLLEPEAEDAYENLIAASRVVTPNVEETAVLTGIDLTADGNAHAAGEKLVEMGAEAALIKGGHISEEQFVDVLVTSDTVERFCHPRVETDVTHGAGCTLSSAIAARLAQGDEIVEAVDSSLELLARAIRYPLDVGEGPGSVQHLVEIREQAARAPTAEAVEEIVREFVAMDVGALVPEVGMNVAGATPYAEHTGETAAVEGRIARTLSGVSPNRGVRFGASGHVARFLLATREFDPDLRFAVNCRLNDRVRGALEELNAPVAEFDHAAGDESATETATTTVARGVSHAFSSIQETPAAVIVPGKTGKEPFVMLLATNPETLIKRVRSVLSYGDPAHS